MKDKKIIFVLHTFEHAGSQFSMLEYGLMAKQLGFKIYFVGESGSFERELKKNEIPHDNRCYIPFSPLSIIGLIKLIRIVVREKPDLIHCNTYWPHIECLFIKALFGIPVVSTFPGGPIFFSKPIIPSGKLISYSDELTKGLKLKYNLNSRQISTIKNRINFSKFRSLIPIQLSGTGKLHYTMIGRMDIEKKNSISSFIHYIESLLSQKRSVEVIMVGGGDLIEYVSNTTKKINQKYEHEVFRLVGHKQDVLPYIVKTHFVVGLGRGVMEGMSAGKPAFVTCQDGHLSLVTRKNAEKHSYYNFAGRFAFNNEEKAIDESNCIRIMDDPKYYGEVSAFVAEYIHRNYDVSYIKNEIEKLYRFEIQSVLSYFQRMKLLFQCIKAAVLGMWDRVKHIRKSIQSKLNNRLS